jgi:DNA-binding NarL/FixJ family response regulator
VHVLRALKAGACGHLLQSVIRTDILDAIRAMHAGHCRIPKEIALELSEHATCDALSNRDLLKVTLETRRREGARRRATA